MKQCLGRGRKEQKQQAIQGLSVCEVGVVSAVQDHSAALSNYTPTRVARFVYSQVIYTQEPPPDVCAFPAPFERGLESKENAGTWSTRLQDPALTPGRSAARC